MKNNKKSPTSWLIIVGFLIFLGFSPIGEPHIVGKLNWVLGGAEGMKAMDWFDFVMHGGSLVIAFGLLLYIGFSLLKKKS